MTLIISAISNCIRRCIFKRDVARGKIVRVVKTSFVQKATHLVNIAYHNESPEITTARSNKAWYLMSEKFTDIRMTTYHSCNRSPIKITCSTERSKVHSE